MTRRERCANLDVMPIFVKFLFGSTEMSLAKAMQWLGQAYDDIQKQIEGRDLVIFDEFLRRKDKTYPFLGQQHLLEDFRRYRDTYHTVRELKENLRGYHEHLRGCRIDDNLAREVMGVKSDFKDSPLSLDFVKTTIEDVLAEESLYIKECLLSLDEQLERHLKGPVDEPGIPRQARASFEQTTLPTDKNSVNPLVEEAKYAYYQVIRDRLMSCGFVVTPPGTALGAVFPEKDWVDHNSIKFDFLLVAKEISDKLMLKYKLIGDDESALTRLLKPSRRLPEGIKEPLVSAVGCLCISWTCFKYRGGRRVYIPFLGLSGVVEKKIDKEYFKKYCRHLALPADLEPRGATTLDALKKDPEKMKGVSRSMKILWKTIEANEDKVKSLGGSIGRAHEQIRSFDLQIKQLKEQVNKEPERVLDMILDQTLLEMEKMDLNAELKVTRSDLERDRKNWSVQDELNTNYDEMVRRTNVCAISYRARETLRLRRPSRQALMSYVSFREKKLSAALEINKLQPRTSDGVDLWICGWHSLNCAEPAALMCASSLFCDGCDVIVCFPYEGLSDTGNFHNRPKETCAWCAAVELGFRSASRNDGGVNASLSSGQWLTQITLNTENEPKKPLRVGKGFDAFDDTNKIMAKTKTTLGGRGPGGLVKNVDLTTLAYPDEIQTKIGRVRSLYYLLGLLDPAVVAVGRLLLSYSRSSQF